ncbi:hypothetical protein D3C87_1983350 [compost metagenome]
MVALAVYVDTSVASVPASMFQSIVFRPSKVSVPAPRLVMVPLPINELDTVPSRLWSKMTEP